MNTAEIESSFFALQYSYGNKTHDSGTVGEGPGYHSPHRGRPGERGGSLPRNASVPALAEIAPLEVLRVVAAIAREGGKPYFVGGMVRDYVMGRQVKDFDIEVFNMPADKLIKVLEQYGRVDKVGASFGVIKLTTDQHNYDFSLPRRDNKAGEGHRGFIVEVDPNMTLEEAASRRDFTMNSLSMDAITGEIHDPFGGIKDIGDGILRETSWRFAEDPLRVLRGMQFAARFGMKPSDSLVQVARGIAGEYNTLAKERVWGEWEKLVLKGIYPSAGISFLQQSGWMEHYPALARAAAAGDLPEIMRVMGEAQRIAKNANLAGDDRAALMFAAMLHKAGTDGAMSFMQSIAAPARLAARVAEMVQWKDFGATDEDYLNEIKIRRAIVALNYASIADVSRLIEAIYGRRHPTYQVDALESYIQEHGTQLKPLILGRHLIDHFGWKHGEAGVNFTEILRDAFDAQIKGEFDTVEGGIEWLRVRKARNDTRDAFPFIDTEFVKIEPRKQYQDAEAREHSWLDGEKYADYALSNLEGVEYRLSQLPFEGIVVWNNGKFLGANAGNETTVHYPDASIERLKGAIATHNHPNDTFFSINDIAGALQGGLSEMRAVISRGTFVFRNHTGKLHPNKVRHLKALMQEAHQRMSQQIADFYGSDAHSPKATASWMQLMQQGFAEALSDAGVKYEFAFEPFGEAPR